MYVRSSHIHLRKLLQFADTTPQHLAHHTVLGSFCTPAHAALGCFDGDKCGRSGWQWGGELPHYRSYIPISHPFLPSLPSPIFAHQSPKCNPTHMLLAFPMTCLPDRPSAGFLLVSSRPRARQAWRSKSAPAHAPLRDLSAGGEVPFPWLALSQINPENKGEEAPSSQPSDHLSLPLTNTATPLFILSFCFTLMICLPHLNSGHSKTPIPFPAFPI